MRGEGVRLAAVLDSTVATLALSAPAGSLRVGETLSVAASAKDKDGNLVLLAADGIGERLDWAVSPVGTATVQGTGAFDLSATVTATLDSPDYAAIPPNPDGAYQITFTGYRYFLQLYNTTDQAATITFHVSLSQTLSGSAASPFGRLAYLPGGGFAQGG